MAANRPPFGSTPSFTTEQIVQLQLQRAMERKAKRHCWTREENESSAESDGGDEEADKSDRDEMPEDGYEESGKKDGGDSGAEADISGELDGSKDKNKSADSSKADSDQSEEEASANGRMRTTVFKQIRNCNRQYKSR